VCENPVMTFPIKQRINNEMFIDRTTAPQTGKTQLRVGTNKLMRGSSIYSAILISKGVGMREQV